METGIKPCVMEEIKMLAKKHHIRKVFLFGSRARGDYWRASDIDLAVEGGNIADFAFDVSEETSTLLKFDVIDLGKPLKQEFLESIRREGVLLYEEI